MNDACESGPGLSSSGTSSNSASDLSVALLAPAATGITRPAASTPPAVATRMNAASNATSCAAGMVRVMRRGSCGVAGLAMASSVRGRGVVARVVRRGITVQVLWSAPLLLVHGDDVGVRNDPPDHSQHQAILDQWGADGWELVQVVPGPDGTGLVAYLKRPRGDA